MADKNFIAKLYSVLFYIFLIVVIASLFQTIWTSARDGNRQIYNSNDCAYLRDAAGNTLLYNTTSGQCYNSTGSTFTPHRLPFRNLFSDTGITMMTFSAFMLFMIFFVVRKAFLRKSGKA